ncbi:MAG TPA: hypothetical protein VM734_22915 [Kofleriaceae bacterium]|jgi:hypothetical protein|nr:hypothetical protein [Kofleriaceae bacterium]
MKSWRLSHRARGAAWALALVLGVTLATVAGACSSNDGGGGRTDGVRITEPEDAIDEELMLALVRAKNFHQIAQVYMSDDKLAEATRAVRQILEVPFPAGAPEAEDVRLDARALLAKLLVRQGQLEAAMTAIDDGLAGKTRDSFFVANLYTVRGEVLRAQAAALDGSSQPADQARAAELRKQAILALEQSNTIAEALQQRLMGAR